MRFHQLPVGETFEYQGQVFVKTGPITAAARDGGAQRCIPRSASVRPVRGGFDETTARQGAAAGLSEATEAAVDAFCRTVMDMIEELAGEDPEVRGYCRGRLEEARRRLLDRLSGGD